MKSPFALAALWENWRDLLTCEPNPLMATFHNRVPIILAPEDYMTWLTVIVFDYVDEMVPVLARMAAKRRTGYRTLGYRVE
ncbi:MULTISPECIES: SOS response-associated peptidase family protein [unclassified Mesorhizobium]|uniref:SOS response-associated peptidase family protein n=1 Tax=unclassified Mesorhizobium TaxID=325217 RepID=UPI00333B5C5C